MDVFISNPFINVGEVVCEILEISVEVVFGNVGLKRADGTFIWDFLDGGPFYSVKEEGGWMCKFVRKVCIAVV